jgi:hypothetical protein
LSKGKENGIIDIHDDIDERYVAALLIIAQSEDIEPDEAHSWVTEFLKEFELDVKRLSAFTTKKDKGKFH